MRETPRLLILPKRREFGWRCARRVLQKLLATMDLKDVDTPAPLDVVLLRRVWALALQQFAEAS